MFAARKEERKKERKKKKEKKPKVVDHAHSAFVQLNCFSSSLTLTSFLEGEE